MTTPLTSTEDPERKQASMYSQGKELGLRSRDLRRYDVTGQVQIDRLRQECMNSSPV